MPSRRAILLGAAAALISGHGVLAGGQVRRIGGLAFGSAWRATLPVDADPGTARRAIETVVAEVDATMSPYRPDSDLGRFNAARHADWLAVSPETCRVAEAARVIAELTDGAFDPTVGPLVGRYGFGPITGEAAALSELEIGAGMLRKFTPGLTLDLCGIAKGHALDRGVEALARLGLSDMLLEMGGEVRALGQHPGGRQWQVGIERPDGASTIQRIVAPGNRALATSGHLPNGFSGRAPLSHVVDPRSGEPAKHMVSSVTVLDTEGRRADALATALLVLGEEAGADLAERHGIDALLLVRDGTGFREIVTSRFVDHLIA